MFWQLGLTEPGRSRALLSPQQSWGSVHFPLLQVEKPSTKRDKISPAPPRKSGQTSKQKWPPIFLCHPITSLFSTLPSLPSGCCFPFLQCICSREAGTVGEVPKVIALQTLVESPGLDRDWCKGVPVSVKPRLCSGGVVLVRNWGWGTQDSTSLYLRHLEQAGLVFGIPSLLKTPPCSCVTSFWMTGSSRKRLEGLLDVTHPP